MTIVIGKKEENKILLGADSQTTTGQTKGKCDKIFESKYIIFGGAGLLSESLLFQDYLEEYKEEISNKKQLFKAISGFYNHLKKLGITDSRQEYDKEVANHFLLVLKTTGQLFKYASWGLIEVDDYAIIGSGATTGLAVMEHGGTINEALEIACKHNLYCGGDINILEIEIAEKELEKNEKKGIFSRLFSRKGLIE